MPTLQPLHDFFSLVAGDASSNPVALDRNHNLFLFGALVSRKPRRVLELGIGSGYVSWSLLHGLRYNGVGSLTCVDSWFDWSGAEPSGVDALRAAGARVVAPVAEEDFVRGCDTDAFDFMVSDADHLRSGDWIDEHLRIVEHDGFMFFHDTNQADVFPSLQKIERRIRELGLPYFHFTESSRDDERCGRGWLFAVNKKAAPAPAAHPAPPAASRHPLVGAPPAPEADHRSRLVTVDVDHGGRQCRFSLRLDPAQMTQSYMLDALAAGVMYEADTSTLLADILAPGDNFVDVGAHVGFFSMLAAALVGPQGRVIAFEPVEENHRHLEEHVARNGLENVYAIRAAVGARQGSAELFVNADNDGGHALWDVGLFPDNAHSRATPERRVVPVTSLDGVLVDDEGAIPVKAIKIDAEGSELHVLEGARRLLTLGRVPYVICEINPFALAHSGASEEAIRAFMRALGYDTFALAPDGGLVPLADDQRVVSDSVFNLVFRHPG